MKVKVTYELGEDEIIEAIARYFKTSTSNVELTPYVTYEGYNEEEKIRVTAKVFSHNLKVSV